MHALETDLINKTRKCRICLQIKSFEDFDKSKVCSHEITGTCKACRSERIQGWYKKNRQRRTALANSRNRKIKAEMIEFFGGKCHDCGKEYPQCVYDFHHIDGITKDFNPSEAMKMHKDKRMAELNKCIMLCANCHRIRHYVDNDNACVT